MSERAEQLLEQLVADQRQTLIEQQKTNQLLTLLIEALAAEDQEEVGRQDATTWLDGSPAE
ncbi:hypothetical protein [Halomonas getboli]|uniref:hypothetical protein n=1 Tax=Halomonas getboli TaxID=2935862 RepID=UPI001FFFD08A|nr:hypothetical protein [Halomonas getboli]MCK2183519.1 hypothetical protein [Halomonas getboli]